jgi:transcriptional regulator of acetoin/glycerol metabolism
MPSTQAGRRSARSAVALPEQPFFASAPQRAALARERLFIEGQRPTGLVAEPIIQSWQRCLVAHRQPGEKLAFDPVTASRRHGALQRGRPLLEAARPALERLQATLARTGVRSFLCDGEGLVLHSSPVPVDTEPVLGLASRLGVNLGEDAVGTTAPGLVLRTGQAVTVTREEHFFDLCGRLSCAAAPIRDRHGRLAGVLDLSTEGRGFAFDAAALVGLYASSIEDALLAEPDGDTLVLHFQADPRLLGTPLQALAGIDAQGLVAWANRAARSLLGTDDLQGRPVAEVFGHEPPTLMATAGARGPQALQLSNGLGVWLRARLQMAPGARSDDSEGLRAPAAVAATQVLPAAEATAPATALEPAPDAAPDAAPTLAEHDHRLVLQALARNGGNVSRAARELGVSRGLLYRRLAAARGRQGDGSGA